MLGRVDVPGARTIGNQLQQRSVAALTSFIPFAGGYVAGLVVWAVAAFAGLGLNAGRAAVLFAYLAASSFVARLVVLGVMDMMGN